LFAECAGGEHADLLGVEPNRPDPVELTLKQAAGLMVLVRDAAGRAAVGAEVEVSQPSREPIVAVTGADGRVELTKLIPAVVEVDATAGTRASVSRKVQLLEGQSVSLEFTVLDTGTIAGRVVGPTGGLDGINAYSKGLGFGKRELLAADGSFSVRLLPGHYRVFPSLKSYHGMSFAKGVEVEANRESRIDFVISKTVTERPLEASAPGTIGASFEDGPGGVSISWVISGSPVDQAGLKQGDLLMAIDGKPLQRALDAFSATRGTPGSPVRIAYRRAGSDAEVVVTRAGGSDL
ncbi:MAG: hypothetical protein H6Q89_5422, partial [Myxococcaceae bacterium]|nr:hypothetical protein [Myxococcaceae bacterium]